MNYCVMSFLSDQFVKLNEEFSKCIGDRGEFTGNFEQFRRRHQAVTRSVGEADRFLMISNVTCFCCQIVGIIIILFSSIFYPKNTVMSSAEGTFLYIFWLMINFLGLSLAAWLAIILTHAVSLFIIKKGPPK